MGNENLDTIQTVETPRISVPSLLDEFSADLNRFAVNIDLFSRGLMSAAEFINSFKYNMLEDLVFNAIEDKDIENNLDLEQLKHNARSPLAKIYSSMKLLGEYPDIWPEVLPVIREGLWLALAFLIELDEYKVDEHEVNIIKLVSEIRAIYPGVKLNLKMIGFESEVATIHPATILKQQIRELIINSVKHGASVVDINAVTLANFALVVEVADNGRGVSAERVREYNEKARQGKGIGPEQGSDDTHGTGAAAIAASGTKIKLAHRPGGGAIQTIQIPLRPSVAEV